MLGLQHKLLAGGRGARWFSNPGVSQKERVSYFEERVPNKIAKHQVPESPTNQQVMKLPEGPFISKQ